MPRLCQPGVIAATVALALAACNDLRDFRGGWEGPRVGDTPALRVGIDGAARAQLAIASLDPHGLTGSLSIDGLVTTAALAPLAGAEADALAGLTFDGGPLRTYLAFVPTTDGGGDVLAVVALYDDERIEVRLLRGGGQPVYAIFDLRR